MKPNSTERCCSKCECAPFIRKGCVVGRKPLCPCHQSKEKCEANFMQQLEGGHCCVCHQDYTEGFECPAGCLQRVMHEGVQGTPCTEKCGKWFPTPTIVNEGSMEEKIKDLCKYTHEYMTDFERDRDVLYGKTPEQKFLAFIKDKCAKSYEAGKKDERERVLKYLKECKDKGFEMETAIYHIKAGVY